MGMLFYRWMVFIVRLPFATLMTISESFKERPVETLTEFLVIYLFIV